MPALEIVKVSETSKCVSHLSPTPVRVPSPSSVSVDMYTTVSFSQLWRLHNSPTAETKKTNEKHITKYTIDHTQERKRESEGGREPGKVRRGVSSVRHSKSKFDCSAKTIPNVANPYYNMACAYAPQDKLLCRDMLLKAERAGFLSALKEHMKTDSDMDVVRESEWFKDLILRL